MRSRLTSPANPARHSVCADKVAGEVAAVLASSETHRQLAADGAEIMPLGPAAFAAFIASEIETWGKVVRQGGIKLE